MQLVLARLKPCPTHVVAPFARPANQMAFDTHSTPLHFLWTRFGFQVLIRRVETLNLTGSSARSESRLKSLFWPVIENGSDVDYLGAQGYWICTLVSIVSLIFLTIAGKPITAAATFLLYYLGGVGVRERSRYAAAVVFAMYLLDTLFSPGVVRILFAALLLSNLRATWIASRWQAGSDESPLPPRLNETWADRFRDTLPAWLWPKIRIFYYIFSGGFLLLTAFGVVAVFLRRLPT